MAQSWGRSSHFFSNERANAVKTSVQLGFIRKVYGILTAQVARAGPRLVQPVRQRGWCHGVLQEKGHRWGASGASAAAVVGLFFVFFARGAAWHRRRQDPRQHRSCSAATP